MTDLTYPGTELELFAHARHWKAYWAASIRRFLGRRVLEVGAGIGSNTLLLRRGTEARWVCLEPDRRLAAILQTRLETAPSCATSEVVAGVVGAMAGGARFDTILYIDVLEHIPDDERELREAAGRLDSAGHLIVLAPAHPWLFSAFDQAVGHCRRYTLGSLQRLSPPGLRFRRGFYLDSVGMLASAANRWFLRQPSPGPKQLAFWDDVLVPCSRVLDPLTAYRLGKSVVCVWTRDG